MAEGAPLLRAYTLTRIEGSNPFLSATGLHMAPDFIPLFASPAVTAGQEGAWIWKSAQNAPFTTELSSEEKTRVSRLLGGDKQHLLATSLIERRSLLARLLGVSANSVRIAHNSEGKPSIQSASDADISLADSRGWNALALSRAGPVGIDLEPLRELDWKPMLSMICTPEEASEVRQVIEVTRDITAFLRCWTTKEAVLKAAGTGMRGGAHRVTVPIDLMRGSVSTSTTTFGEHVYRLDTVERNDLVVTRALRVQPSSLSETHIGPTS